MHVCPCGQLSHWRVVYVYSPSDFHHYRSSRSNCSFPSHPHLVCKISPPKLRILLSYSQIRKPLAEPIQHILNHRKRLRTDQEPLNFTLTRFMCTAQTCQGSPAVVHSMSNWCHRGHFRCRSLNSPPNYMVLFAFCDISWHLSPYKIWGSDLGWMGSKLVVGGKPLIRPLLIQNEADKEFECMNSARNAPWNDS